MAARLARRLLPGAALLLAYGGLLAAAPGAAAYGPSGTNHFKQWYPQWSGFFPEYMEQCGAQYARYLTYTNPRCKNCPANDVVDCLMEQAPENMKANMAAAAVLLGLLPTILSMAGSTTAETGLLSLRRPLLAFLLSAGGPAVSPFRALEYRAGVSDRLDPREDSWVAPNFSSPAAAAAVSLLEYLFASAAIANLAHASWELGLQCVSSFATKEEWLPALWAFVAIAIHLVGSVALRLRMKLVFHQPEGEGEGEPGLDGGVVVSSSSSSSSSSMSWLARWLREEGRLSCDPSLDDALLVFKRERWHFVFLSWATSLGVIFHLLYGTLVFSSILFISTEDALQVCVRFLASALVCRVILVFELSGMRGSVRVVEPARVDARSRRTAERSDYAAAPPFKPERQPLGGPQEGWQPDTRYDPNPYYSRVV